MMKNSFKLSLKKEDLFKSIKARFENKILHKESFDKSEFKKIIESTKEKKQNIILYFNEENDVR